MNKRSDILGVVLAGGKSTRLGAEKALLPLRGRPMIQIVAETLSTVFADVIIAGGRFDQLGFLGLPVVSDSFPECGPLAGIHAALSHSQARSIFVLSCDTPFIPPELIEYVLDFKSSSPTKITLFEDKLQPLCGLYSAACLPFLRSDLEQGKLSVLKSLLNIDFAPVPISASQAFFTPELFRNINCPEDYQFISTLEPAKSYG